MTTLIIDDEFMQANYLTEMINKHCKDLKVTAHFDNPVEGLKYLSNNSVDLLFLDVEMPEMTGFEFIEIFGIEKLPPVIFTTAYSKYAVNAFKINALDYLLKPVDPDELKRAVKKAKQANDTTAQLQNLLNQPVSESADRLILTEGQSHVFVKLSEIIYIKGSGSYTYFHLQNGDKITTSKRLNYYWNKLENTTFIRCHQSFVVNTTHVQRYDKADGGELLLTLNYTIPVSSRLREEVKEKLGVTG